MMPNAITIPLVVQAIFLRLSFVPHLILHVLETMPVKSLIIQRIGTIAPLPPFGALGNFLQFRNKWLFAKQSGEVAAVIVLAENLGPRGHGGAVDPAFGKGYFVRAADL